MIKIGFVDRYLDNWHSNHYPEYLSLGAELYGIAAKITHAYAERDTPDEYGMTTKAWCEQYDCIPCETYEELIDSVDAIMVMCADDCLPHEELAEKALMSGKPVYCDKTFAPTKEAAKRMFDLAKKYNTPVFTCSAQRFCMELLSYKRQITELVDYCASTSPGDMVNYSIHQYEMLQMLMGTGAKRCQAFISGETVHIIYQYMEQYMVQTDKDMIQNSDQNTDQYKNTSADQYKNFYTGGRMCTFTQGRKLPFSLFAATKTEGVKNIEVSDYYMNFMNKLLHFFLDKRVPVTREETMEIMAMQQAGRKAIENPGIWIDVN
ncbi:Gfo/Idh/MocA family oxidoreductase [Anaerocolumna sp. AGMB13025]|uniref:Gfo/Idh/MocA family protein n=1 Tax=Anaerocolumna sp. AGMB13025 TaxID=3039116 RepID=UPI00241FBF29|nr:Gfo/Idh/MocA family oxidoreductase [Anaerocolumna sp. AGMB13025]WFR57450.1 Gfo/Idh/MocA family oxidoreductase [Anaerocolumna sp. AGMB13025]